MTTVALAEAKVAEVNEEGPMTLLREGEAVRVQRDCRDGPLRSGLVCGRTPRPSRRSPPIALFGGHRPWSTVGSKVRSDCRGHGNGLLGGGCGLTVGCRAVSSTRCRIPTITTAATGETTLCRLRAGKSPTPTGGGRVAFTPISFRQGRLAS